MEAEPLSIKVFAILASAGPKIASTPYELSVLSHVEYEPADVVPSVLVLPSPNATLAVMEILPWWEASLMEHDTALYRDISTL